MNRAATVSVVLLTALAGVVILLNSTWVAVTYGGGGLHRLTGWALIVAAIVHISWPKGHSAGWYAGAGAAAYGISYWGWPLEIFIVPGLLMLVGFMVNSWVEYPKHSEQSSKEPYV